MASMTDYRKLCINDVVILIRIPEPVKMTVCSLRDGPDGILRVYQRAMDKKSMLRVYLIDEYGYPWVEYSFKNKSNIYEYHFMMVDDDAYELTEKPSNQSLKGRM